MFFFLISKDHLTNCSSQVLLLSFRTIEWQSWFWISYLLLNLAMQMSMLKSWKFWEFCCRQVSFRRNRSFGRIAFLQWLLKCICTCQKAQKSWVEFFWNFFFFFKKKCFLFFSLDQASAWRFCVCCFLSFKRWCAKTAPLRMQRRCHTLPNVPCFCLRWFRLWKVAVLLERMLRSSPCWLSFPFFLGTCLLNGFHLFRVRRTNFVFFFFFHFVFFARLSGLKIKDHLHSLLRAGTRLLSESLPRNWFAMSVFVARTLVKLCLMVRTALVARIQSFPREIPVWTLFFELLFALVLLPQLQLEYLTESKRQLLMRRYGDLRIEAAMVLRKSWNELKILQSMFVPKFVTQFLMLILSKQPDIREIGVDMYWGVLLREIRDTNSFKVVKKERIFFLNLLCFLKKKNKKGWFCYDWQFGSSFFSRRGKTCWLCWVWKL